jgi:hypothetical protein
VSAQLAVAQRRFGERKNPSASDETPGAGRSDTPVQRSPDSLSEADDKRIAHHEGTTPVGHASICPAVREAIETLELNGR